jgi:hypothetical protein
LRKRRRKKKTDVLDADQENQEAANGHANGQSDTLKSGHNMVKTFQAYLPPTNRTYSCVHCRAHLASHDELISKVSLSKPVFAIFQDFSLSVVFQSFQGSQGRAYLFNSV